MRTEREELVPVTETALSYFSNFLFELSDENETWTEKLLPEKDLVGDPLMPSIQA